jgi:hypothetical protein
MLLLECLSVWMGWTRLAPCALVPRASYGRTGPASRTCASRFASCAPAPHALHGRTGPALRHVRSAPRASCHAHPSVPHTFRASHSALPVSRASCRAPSASRVVLPHAHIDFHWAAASRWVRVATVCFMRFRCILHMFHLDVTKVDLVLLILPWLYTCVASVCFKCFSCFKCTLQTRCCICCKGYTYMLQVCISNVSGVSSRCCMFSSGCCICCSGYTCMFQVYISNVLPFSDVCCKCFI